jgi:hypothetical protein
MDNKKINNNLKQTKLNNVLISIDEKNYVTLQNDIENIKKDINDIKNTLVEIVKMINIYEFKNI